jgi:hypothetical protein
MGCFEFSLFWRRGPHRAWVMRATPERLRPRSVFVGNFPYRLRFHKTSNFPDGALMGLIILILLVVLLFGGGLGTTYGGWGGAGYGHYGYGGIGLGTILLIVLLFMLFRRA